MLTTKSNLALSTLLVLCLIAPLVSASKYGLYSKKGESLELLKLSTKAIIEGPYAQIEFIQVYKNPYGQPIETEFLFPRTDSSIFHRFEAIFRNKTIVGHIFEKEKAKTMYQKSIEQGHTAAYSERSVASPDVMKIKVGNIPAEESVEIKFSIIQPLDLIANKLWSFTLPVVLTERYTGTLSPTSNPSKPTEDKTIPFASTERQTQTQTQTSTSSSSSHSSPSNPSMETTIISNVDLYESKYKEWHVEVDIKTDSPFEFISNPSHDLKPTLSEKTSGHSSKVYRATWDVVLVPNKNFVVYFKPKQNQELGMILAEHQEYPNDYVFLVNFVPDLSALTMETITQTLEDKEEGFLKLNKLVQENDQQSSRREFIFIVDRSQSMGGHRLQNLKRSLTKFFEVLPADSYFNIIGFGSWMTMYREQSIKNSPGELEKVREWIRSLDSNYGGTEILAPLHKAVSLPDIENYPRVVILLTDGDVYSPDGVIKIARDNHPKIRFYTIGIGNGVSEYLIRSVAKEGGGLSEFVLDSEDISDKAGYMIKSAMSEHLKDIDLKVNCYDNNKSHLTSFSKKIKILLKNQPFQEWVYLEDLKNVGYCTATIQYFNSLTNSSVTKEVTIDEFGNAELTDFWHKLAYDAKMRDLDTEIRFGDFRVNKIELKSQIVRMSTKYQVLSDYTSFFAVLAENTKTSNETTMKVTIENLESADCNNAGTCKHYHQRQERSQNSDNNNADAGQILKVDERVSVDVEAAVDVETNVVVDITQGECDSTSVDVNIAVDSGLDLDVDINIADDFSLGANVNIDVNLAVDVEVDVDVDVDNRGAENEVDIEIETTEDAKGCETTSVSVDIDVDTGLDVDLDVYLGDTVEGADVDIDVQLSAAVDAEVAVDVDDRNHDECGPEVDEEEEEEEDEDNDEEEETPEEEETSEDEEEEEDDEQGKNVQQQTQRSYSMYLSSPHQQNQVESSRSSTNFAGMVIREKTNDGFVSIASNPDKAITANIEKVVLKIGHVFDAIALIYDDNTVVHFGGDGGTNQVFELEKGEKIVAISGTYKSNVITSLKFRTSKGRVEEFKSYLCNGGDSSFSFKFKNGEYLASVQASTYHWYHYHVVLEKLTFILQQERMSLEDL